MHFNISLALYAVWKWWGQKWVISKCCAETINVLKIVIWRRASADSESEFPLSLFSHLRHDQLTGCLLFQLNQQDYAKISLSQLKRWGPTLNLFSSLLLSLSSQWGNPSPQHLSPAAQVWAPQRLHGPPKIRWRQDGVKSPKTVHTSRLYSARQ